MDHFFKPLYHTLEKECALFMLKYCTALTFAKNESNWQYFNSIRKLPELEAGIWLNTNFASKWSGGSESCRWNILVWFSRILANALTLWVIYRINQCNCTLLFSEFEAVEGRDYKSLAIRKYAHICTHALSFSHMRTHMLTQAHICTQRN